MSASNSPANPNTPRSGPKPSRPTLLARHGPKILTGGILLGVLYAYAVAKPPSPAGTRSVNPLRTTGVQNIEKAYTNGGATPTHTKAYGGTVQGSRDDQMREDAGTGKTAGFDEEHIGDRQRGNAPEVGMRKFKDMQYGSEHGK